MLSGPAVYRHDTAGVIGLDIEMIPSFHCQGGITTSQLDQGLVKATE